MVSSPDSPISTGGAESYLDQYASGSDPGFIPGPFEPGEGLLGNHNSRDRSVTVLQPINSLYRGIGDGDATEKYSPPCLHRSSLGHHSAGLAWPISYGPSPVSD